MPASIKLWVSQMEIDTRILMEITMRKISRNLNLNEASITCYSQIKWSKWFTLHGPIDILHVLNNSCKNKKGKYQQKTTEIGAFHQYSLHCFLFSSLLTVYGTFFMTRIDQEISLFVELTENLHNNRGSDCRH